MKECRVCKSPISEGEHFCHTCGARIPFNQRNSSDESKRALSNEELDADEQQSNETNTTLSDSSSLIPDEMLFSTTSILNGYSITKYLGLVFGSSLYSSISKDNLHNDKAKIEYIEKSNQIALLRMIEHGQLLGATAIIGITMQQTAENGSILVTFCGTAVTISPEETTKATIPVSQDDIRIVEDSLSDTIPNAQQEEAHGEHPVGLFLRRILNSDDTFEIWNVWKESGLEEDNPEVDALILKRKHEAQSFGKFTNTQMKNLKSDLYKLLSSNNDIWL